MFVGHAPIHGGPLRLPVFLSVLFLAGLPATLAASPLTSIQHMTPSVAYFAGINGPFADGDYRDALSVFQGQGRSVAVKTAQSRWIDSICYETMCAECYLQMGENAQALEHYSAALKLFVAFSDWMTLVQFQPIRAASASNYRQVPWGQSTRQAKLGQYPEQTPISQGRIDNSAQIQYGGVVTPPVLFMIQVQEIVRCTALAIRRRAMLMGPVGSRDPLTNEVAAALLRRPGPPNHWSQAWVDLQLGLALVATGRDAQAVPYLQRAIVAGGEYDHPLTSTALLELGLINMTQGNFAPAIKFFDEATYAAVNYPDPGVLEEAFRYAAVAHLMSNHPGVYPPLLPALAWAKTMNRRQLHASLALMLAENHVTQNRTADAMRFLDEARRAIARHQMGAGWIGARLNFLAATASYQRGIPGVADGDKALTLAVSYLRAGSIWMFQIGLADRLYTAGAVTSRLAMDLYQGVLRDPQASDWSADPMESLAVLVTPHLPPLEHWFEVAMEHKDYEAALEISDRVRRHRFFSSIALGGRLQALRWVLGAPVESLDHQAQLNRQDLLVRYPRFAQLAQQAQQIRSQLMAQPLVGPTPEARREQSRLLAELGDTSFQQEAILREMAVRRDPAEMVFPPLRSTRQVQKSLLPGHAVLVFFSTSRHYYGFLLNNQRYTFWTLGAPSAMSRRVAELLRQMGNYEQNHELTLKDLNDEQWKTTAEKMLEMLLKGSQADFSQPFDELTIVPDGALWDLPFDALQVTADKQLHALLSRVRIRYVPTMSLAMADGRSHKPGGRTGVVVGQLYSRDSEPAAQAAFQEIARVLPGAEALTQPLPSSSALYSSLLDRLIVLDQIAPPETPVSWAPIPIDRNKAGNTLSDWMGLPWEGPETVILPGFHTAAENALKRATNPALAGQDLFLTVCSLMSCGARTVLLSRWRTGGQTSYDLVREFVQELPHAAPSDAWQRSVVLTVESRINYDGEPRIKRSADDADLRANHPFFWAGYLLVDSSGEITAEAPKDESVIKFKGPDVKPAGPAEGKDKGAGKPGNRGQKRGRGAGGVGGGDK
jgi:tetratricopeptide (TPR) repeat protein